MFRAFSSWVSRSCGTVVVSWSPFRPSFSVMVMSVFLMWVVSFVRVFLACSAVCLSEESPVEVSKRKQVHVALSGVLVALASFCLIGCGV